MRNGDNNFLARVRFLVESDSIVNFYTAKANDHYFPVFLMMQSRI